MNKKYLKAKKNNDKARVKFFADKIGTIKRGYLADYFRTHRKDYSAVKKALKNSIYSQRYRKILTDDVKSFYRHSTYSAEESKEFIADVENTFFTPYMRFNILQRVETSLESLPKFIED